VPDVVLSRAERRRRTREHLLEAAAVVFKRSGFHGASVAQIAAEAGYTIGAVYSNFEGKEDLLLAIIERESRRVAEDVVAAASGARSPMGKLRRGAEAWTGFLGREGELYAVFMELWAVGTRNPKLRARNAAIWASVRDALGTLAKQHAESVGKRLRLPPEQVGAAVMALCDGLAIQQLEDPDAVPPELLGTLLGKLVPSLM
jgi:AcrR family transcriptional regulator